MGSTSHQPSSEARESTVWSPHASPCDAAEAVFRVGLLLVQVNKIVSVNEHRAEKEPVV